LALSAIQVQVHPLVLLSVTDHASRSATGARKRVLGVLLGQDNGASINVANSFAVPFEEDEGGADGAKSTWFLDHDYIESMMEMSKKVTGECAAWQARREGGGAVRLRARACLAQSKAVELPVARAVRPGRTHLRAGGLLRSDTVPSQHARRWSAGTTRARACVPRIWRSTTS
jgi:hypothetical protein